MLKIRRFLEYRRCASCGKEFISCAIEKINKKDYVCSFCRESHSYCARNRNYQGKQTQISFSFEFETGYRSKELYELLKYKFLACYDGSIAGLEWKSPIFYNRKIFHSICKKIDKFSRFVDNSCGTHLHVSTQYKDKIKEYENQLFTPILNEMSNNRQKTEKFWGRYFSHYCRKEISDCRYNSFNTRSSVETLEFRLLKFINSEQYIRACDFCIDITKYINNVISKDNFNDAQAVKVGQTILNKYREVIRNV